jgi:hypothetical protein
MRKPSHETVDLHDPRLGRRSGMTPEYVSARFPETTVPVRRTHSPCPGMTPEGRLRAVANRRERR